MKKGMNIYQKEKQKWLLQRAEVYKENKWEKPKRQAEKKDIAKDLFELPSPLKTDENIDMEPEEISQNIKEPSKPKNNDEAYKNEMEMRQRRRARTRAHREK